MFDPDPGEALQRCQDRIIQRGAPASGRDREKSEVDFLLVRGKKPLVLVEARLSETEPAPALIKMKKALGIPAVQLVNAP